MESTSSDNESMSASQTIRDKLDQMGTHTTTHKTFNFEKSVESMVGALEDDANDRSPEFADVAKQGISVARRVIEALNQEFDIESTDPSSVARKKFARASKVETRHQSFDPEFDWEEDGVVDEDLSESVRGDWELFKFLSFHFVNFAYRVLNTKPSMKENLLTLHEDKLNQATQAQPKFPSAADQIRGDGTIGPDDFSSRTIFDETSPVSPRKRTRRVAFLEEEEAGDEGEEGGEGREGVDPLTNDEEPGDDVDGTEGPSDAGFAVAPLEDAPGLDEISDIEHAPEGGGLLTKFGRKFKDKADEDNEDDLTDTFSQAVATCRRVTQIAVGTLFRRKRAGSQEPEHAHSKDDLRKNIEWFCHQYCAARYDTLSLDDAEHGGSNDGDRFEAWMGRRTKKRGLQVATGVFVPYAKSSQHAAAEYFAMETLWTVFVRYITYERDAVDGYTVDSEVGRLRFLTECKDLVVNNVAVGTRGLAGVSSGPVDFTRKNWNFFLKVSLAVFGVVLTANPFTFPMGAVVTGYVSVGMVGAFGVRTVWSQVNQWIREKKAAVKYGATMTVTRWLHGAINGALNTQTMALMRGHDTYGLVKQVKDVDVANSTMGIEDVRRNRPAWLTVGRRGGGSGDGSGENEGDSVGWEIVTVGRDGALAGGRSNGQERPAPIGLLACATALAFAIVAIKSYR